MASHCPYNKIQTSSPDSVGPAWSGPCLFKFILSHPPCAHISHFFLFTQGLCTCCTLPSRLPPTSPCTAGAFSFSLLHNPSEMSKKTTPPPSPLCALFISFTAYHDLSLFKALVYFVWEASIPTDMGTPGYSTAWHVLWYIKVAPSLFVEWWSYSTTPPVFPPTPAPPLGIEQRLRRRGWGAPPGPQV